MSQCLEVQLPYSGYSELSYTLSVLLGEILGIEYTVKPWDRPLHRFSVPGQGRVDLADAFFNRFGGMLDYLSTSNIPPCAGLVASEFCPEQDLPVIFMGPGAGEDTGIEHGDGGLSFSVQHKTVTWDCDLLASAFFMLSRWEETAAYLEAGYPERLLASEKDEVEGPGPAPEGDFEQGRAYRWAMAAGLVRDHMVEKPWPAPLDQHGRFPASASLAGRSGFLHRPLVNEYAATLLNMFKKVGFQAELKKSSYEIIPTHDVDWIGYSKPWITIAQDFFRDRQPVRAMERAAALLGAGKPWDRFDWLMGLSEAAGVKSRFYLMAGGENCLDGNCGKNHEELRNLAARIRHRDHEIGFHPGYATFEDRAEWSAQKERLEEICGFPVREGRQHYLRCAAPWTWRLWDAQGMEVDSTMGYADQQGFRCGTGNTFTLYDVLERKPMTLRERPLIIMDGTLAHYRGFDARGALAAYETYRAICKRNHTPLTVLIHNSHLDSIDWKGWARSWKEFMAAGNVSK